MARRLTNKGKAPDHIKHVSFLPDMLDQVKAVAMQGISDVEMAELFGINPRLLQKWKDQYPSFSDAIRRGRTVADVAVVEALFKKSVGYTYTKEVVVRSGKETDVHTIEHVVEPETNAIKFWLSNRQRENWGERQHIQLTGKAGEPGIKSETKLELVSSILSLIQPKPDNEKKKPE